MSPDSPDGSPFTVPEFCRRNRIGVTKYYELRPRGLGPREMRVDSKVLITPAAEADWRRDREATHDDALVERLRERGRKAARGKAARRNSAERNHETAD